MKLTNPPISLPIPFASAASPGTLNVIPIPSQVGITAGAASYETGFPTTTFLDPADGGVAPLGADFNGVLNAITQSLAWVQAGGSFQYNATFSADIFGYPLGAILQRADATGGWINTIDQNTSNPDTGGAGWLPYGGSTTPLSLSVSNTNATLTALQAASPVVYVSGVLTADVTIYFPNWNGAKWLLVERTTGAFTVSVSTASGSALALSAGTNEVYGDGENILAISQSGNSGGIVKTIVAGENINVDNTDPANPVVSADPGGVSSVNSITGAVTIAPGANVTVTESGGTITIGATGGGGGSGPIPQYDFQTDFGGDPTFATDSTAAFQTALNTLVAAGGGELFMGYNAHYKIGGALQDTSRGNAQVIVPNAASGSQQVLISIIGGLVPATSFSVVGATPLPTEGVVIESTLTSGNGSLFGGWGIIGSVGDFVAAKVVLQNLVFRTVNNPTITAVDLSHIADVYVDNVVCDTGNYELPGSTQPTTATSFGIRYPGNNNDAYTYVGTVAVGGFYNGQEIGEHTVGIMLSAWGCLNGFSFSAAYHASCIQRLEIVWCQNPVVCTGIHYTRIAQLDIEHADTGGWENTVYDVNDPSDQLFGDLKWHVVLAHTGIVSTFTKNGGGNLLTQQLGVNTATGQALVNGNSQTSSYTLALSDFPTDGTLVDVQIFNAGGTTLTIPQNSSVPIPVGSQASVTQFSSGVITVVAGTGVTFLAPFGVVTAAQGDSRYLRKLTTNTWQIL